jgi:hypothetical protein
MMSQRLWLGILLLVGASIAPAQVRVLAQETASGARLLTLRDGEKIVNAAWEREQKTGRRPDCSHLVHEVYALAGYPYPYADSFDLYVGTEGFVRMATPHPGDLVVWRGHVGIVVDPAKHSFYSSLNSGLRTEFYDAREWRARGPARFYRYANAAPGKLTPANEGDARITKEPTQVVTAPLVRGSPETSSTALPMTKNSDSSATASRDLGAPSSVGAFEIPSSILVAASQDKPTQAEIADAVSELNNGSGNVLREEDLSQVGRKVIIYDDLRIERAEFRGKRGSAHARIESRVTLIGESIERKPQHEKFRWELLRVSGGWEVLVPKDRIYVPRDVAVRMLAERLASLVQASGVSDSDLSIRQQARIVHILSALFEEGAISSLR